MILVGSAPVEEFTFFFFFSLFNVLKYPKQLTAGKEGEVRNVPGGPVVKIPCFHYRGHGFHPRSGN